LQYEETHADQILKMEAEWRKQYEAKKVNEPLIRLNVNRMQAELQKWRNEDDPCEESGSPRKRGRPGAKTKQI
jgi:hypothetical protein